MQATGPWRDQDIASCEVILTRFANGPATPPRVIYGL